MRRYTRGKLHPRGGLRVEKQVGNATPTVYIFLGTKVIAEYNLGAAATDERQASHSFDQEVKKICK